MGIDNTFLKPEGKDLCKECKVYYFFTSQKVKDSIEILEKHNEWRRGGEDEMEDPKQIGSAIDTVVNHFKKIK